MSKQWDRDWMERERQRRAKADRLMGMVRGDLDRREVDRDLDRAKRRREKDAPTFSECVIGYRQWAVDALDQLWPMAVSHRPWEPGTNKAVCDADKRQAMWISGGYLFGPGEPHRKLPRKHRAPHRDCECGLYAWRRIQPAWMTREGQLKPPVMPPVTGAVAFWGDVQIHRAGFRAEKACVVTLAHHDDERSEVIAALERVARRYRVELVALSDLEVAASRHGTPLPDSLQPPAPIDYFAQHYQSLAKQFLSGSGLTAAGAASKFWG
jgi:hypothetical protein